MTPLAFRMAKDLTLPVKRRRAIDDFALATAKKLGGAHCFDVTAAWPVIEDLAMKIAYDGHDVGPLGFLPAEKTWIEYDASATTPEKHFSGREGYLLESKAGGRFADITWCSECGDYSDEQLRLMSSGEDIGKVKWGYQAANDDQLLYLFHDANSRVHWTGRDVGPDITDPDERDALANWEPGVIFAALALINSPRIIGRRQHMPHRGLERDLIARKKLIGKFPLHAWTEIRLEVNSTPRDASADASTEAHLTGERALHFCRAHLRIRLGRLEIVSAHWRGNPSLGIKRSRYRLEMPRAEVRA